MSFVYRSPICLTHRSIVLVSHAVNLVFSTHDHKSLGLHVKKVL